MGAQPCQCDRPIVFAAEPERCLKCGHASRVTVGPSMTRLAERLALEALGTRPRRVSSKWWR